MPAEVQLPPFLKQGEPARLIPVVADASKEQRITSAFLAVFASVDEFGKSMLQLVKAPATKTSKISCFTETIFKNGLAGLKHRPDGLIVVTTGSRSWSAIVEAKVGDSALSPEQVETYLDIAKENKIDAVITISNQFAALPTHHPIGVNKRKTKAVSLYHWSWMSVVSEARLLAEHKGVSDPDQAFLLKELIRYLQHPSSGVLSFTRMRPRWKELCTMVQQGNRLAKNAPAVVDSIGDWHQLTRYIGLQMSLAIGRNVIVNMSRAHAEDPSKRLNEAIACLVDTQCLEEEFSIPNAAARLKVCADVNRRTLTVSMRLKAPTDRARATALVNWAMREVAKCEDDGLVIRAIWPGRAPDTMATLAKLREEPKTILHSSGTLLPIAFEFARIIDVAGRFKGSATFVEHAVAAVPDFYRDVGQHLRAWIPPAPKVVGDGKDHVTELPAVDTASVGLAGNALVAKNPD